MSDRQSEETKDTRRSKAADSAETDKFEFGAYYHIFNSSDADEHSRINALLGLCRIAPDGPSNQILQILINAVRDSSPAIRQYAVIALGKFGSFPVVSTLVSALEDPSLRLAALYSLASLHEFPEIAVPAIIAIITNGDLFERREAILTLSAYGNHGKAAIPVLQSIIRNGDTSLRQVARFALQAIAHRNANQD